MHTNTPPSSPDDARIERLLRELASQHIDDGGFTARTLHALPKRHPRRRTLILGVATGLASAIVLPLAGPAALDLLETAGNHVAMTLEHQPALPAYVSLGLGLLLVALTTVKVLVGTR